MKRSLVGILAAVALVGTIGSFNLASWLYFDCFDCINLSFLIVSILLRGCILIVSKIDLT